MRFFTSLNHQCYQVVVFKCLCEHPFLIFYINNLAATEVVSSETQIEMLRDLVTKLYLDLNIEEHEKQKEIEILKKIETLRSELAPLEKVKYCI